MSKQTSELLHTIAKDQEGTWEWAGSDHNPAVLAMYAASGHPQIDNDEVPWCAAFVGSVLAEAGLQNTGSLMARSYSKWGVEVERADACIGDIVVLKRGSDPRFGHVAFLNAPIVTGMVSLLGGNQGNQVRVSQYNPSDIVSIRRAKVVVPRKSMAQSKTLQALTASGGGMVYTLSQVWGGLETWEKAVALLVVAGLAYAARERVKKWLGGVR
tara:strand:- start:921 stop:1559 length:639 start_codon:yes stop_codon:yes gene_type:complete